MNTPSRWTVDELLRHPEVDLVDIRPRAERYEPTGFIPGSLSVPIETDADVPSLGATGSGGFVIYCLSGRRSEHLLESAARAEGCLGHMEGGLLTWQGHGQPVAAWPGRELPRKGEDAADLAALVRSCFVAEMVNQAADEGDAVDVLGLLRLAYSLEGVEPDAVDELGLVRVIERLGVLSRKRMGTSAQVIERNTSYLFDQIVGRGNPAP